MNKELYYVERQKRMQDSQAPRPLRNAGTR